MRVLMFGRGVIATIYGHALESAGHDVEFYVRPGRAAEYGNTVRLDLIDARHSPLGGRINRTVPVKIRESVEQEDGFDLVILSVAHHQLASAAAYLAPRVGNATVLILGNMWEEPLAAVAPLPPSQVVLGFPQAGGGFGTDGILHGAVFRTVIVESDNGRSRQRHAAVQNAFRQAGFTIRRQWDMRGWLWLHFVADAGMHAQGVHHRGLAGLIGNRRGLREALLTTRELLPILRARGIDLSHHRRALLPFRFPVPTAAAMAWATAHLPIAQVSLSAHTDPDAAEPRTILRDTLHEAQRLGVHAHRLEESLGAPAKSADI